MKTPREIVLRICMAAGSGRNLVLERLIGIRRSKPFPKRPLRIRVPVQGMAR